MTDTEVTIATSIAPKNIESQKIAISSWISLGFKVISLNSLAEISMLQEHFLGVRFIAASRNGTEKVGKPLVLISDILSSLWEGGSDICGIFNSDIVLCPPEGFYDFVRNEVKGCLLYGSRIEVENFDKLVGDEYLGGYDYFIFDRSVISSFPDTQFCMGAPWWDYWMCLTPLVRKIPVKRVLSKIAYHKMHDKNWSYDLWFMYCKYFVVHVVICDGVFVRYPSEAIRMLIHLLKKDYGTFSEDVVTLINRKSLIVSFAKNRS